MFCYCVQPFSASAQTQTPKQEQSEDVIKITTELVQTDVMVFDRRGQFVEGLKPQDFMLSLDGKSRQVSIFERVTSGSAREAAQLRVAGSSSTIQGRTNPATTDARSVGRTILFFVDDLHLSGESLLRVRKTLLTFIDSRMDPADQVAIVSSSGQIGFLQQLTDNPTVLRTAVARLNYKRNQESYAGSTRISEYMANRVENGGDRRLFAYLMESVKLEYGMSLGSLRGDHGNNSGLSAYAILKSRLGQISAQSRVDTMQTVAVLQSLMESSAALPGRKLVFFLSDGFMTGPRSTDTSLQQATRLAARTGAVIYSVDMRGTMLDSSVDASHNDYVDMGSRHAGVSIGETTAPRDPLNTLASETGGRLIINSTDLNNDLAEAVRETTDYYMLAWRPSSEPERLGKSKVEVSIPGRPELKVHWRRNYFVNQTTSASAPLKNSAATSVTPEIELLVALGSSRPQRDLPTALSVGYLQSESGPVLKASMQTAREAFNFSDPKQKVDLDVIGAAIDDRGLIYTFKQVLTVTAAPEAPETPVIWNQQFNIKPGLYQVRVAVRERGSGRSGSAMQWIEIPSTVPPQFSMSSLFLGERHAEERTLNQQSDGPQPVRVDVDHRFARGSALRFQTYIYNASRVSGAPEVWIQAHVLRGRQQVAAVAPSRIPPDVSKDPRLLPYWSEIALKELPPGRYVLEVSATDRPAGVSTSQRISFSVE
ncbi:MAG: VWA domain-containing protein [Acidobacteriota bacterium]